MSWSDWKISISNILFKELVVIDGTPLTVALVCKGFLLLALGYYISRRLSQAIEYRVFSRLDIDISLKHTLGTMTFYFFLSILLFLILNLLNLPLSVFAWIGGAFALGIGLGSQNIVNNFISGLVMMAERPVKVGDVIEVDGFTGMVEHIGARSTQIKSLNNTHIIVPNSSFLEKTILNWTLSDDVVRTMVTVGVAYGSPTKKVERLLVECAFRQKSVLQEPLPIALLTQFGESSLEFQLFFWTELKSVAQLRRLESEVRHTINEIFNQNHIVVAFPQLDVHLTQSKSTRPSLSL